MNVSTQTSLGSSDITYDVVEEYDYYESHRREFIKKLHFERDIQPSIQQKKKKDQSLQWRHDGVKLVNQISETIDKVHSVLNPHQFKRENMIAFNRAINFSNYLQIAGVLPSIVLKSPSRILRAIKPATSRSYLKVNLMERLFVIHMELKWRRKLHNGLDNMEYEKFSKTKVIRRLFRTFANYVRVDEAIRKELIVKRNKLKKALDKQDRIYKAMKSCEFITICKSAQHNNPKGCSNCGVIRMGGTIDAVLYVRSKSRDTGVETLVTLDFENETLKTEEVIQIKVVKTAEDELNEFEDQLYSNLIYKIQHWWCIVILWKRCQTNEHRCHQSQTKYKHRRLVKLKREIDILIKERDPPDMIRLEAKYCDILPELHEHVTSELQKKWLRIKKVAMRMRSHLYTIVDDGRERRRLELLRKMTEKPPEKPIVIKKVKIIQEPVLICYRNECHGRQFLSKDRYDTHMAIHRQADDAKYEQQKKNEWMGKERKEEEKEFKQRWKETKEYMDGTPSYINTLDRNRSAMIGSLTLDTRNSMIQDELQLSSSSSMGLFPMSNTNPRDLTIETLLALMDHNTDDGAMIQGSSDNIPSRAIPTPYDDSPIDALTEFIHEQSTNRIQSPSMKESSPSSFPNPFLSTHTSSLSPTRKLFNIQHPHPVTMSTTSEKKSDPSHHSTHYGPSPDKNYGIRTKSQAIHPLRPLKWLHQTPHLPSLNAMHNNPLYYLEILSHRAEIIAPNRIALDRPVIRIGTHSCCEYVIKIHGEAMQQAMIAPVHCIVYCPMSQVNIHEVTSSLHRIDHRSIHTYTSSVIKEKPTHPKCASSSFADISQLYSTDMMDPLSFSFVPSSSHQDTKPTLVDNHTVWGTYIVTEHGTKKLPTKVTTGLEILPGHLICIGVIMKGSTELTPTDANKACLVYRARCEEKEKELYKSMS